MNSKIALKRLEQSLVNIRALTRVFEHIASKKMDINRQEIARLQNYLEEAVETYSQAKVAHAEKDKSRDAILRTAYRAPGKRKVLIMVTSESKYVGNLIKSMARLFIKEFRQGGCDGIVVGDAGKRLLLEQGFKEANVTYFDFNDDKPDWNTIVAVNAQIGNYLEAVVFWGKYKSILSQEIEREDVGKNVVVTDVAKAKNYDFERGAKMPLALLERQIMSSVFVQKLYETGLTKNAVQVKILEIGAIAERINAAMAQLAKFKLRMNKDSNNRKQTQLYASKSVWEKGGVFAVER